MEFTNHQIAGRGSAATLGVACLLGLAGWLATGHAWAANETIENTAQVSFRLDGRGTSGHVQSNTVRIEVLPIPTPATLQFLRYDPDAAQGERMAIDGGQCRVSGGGFESLPPVHDRDGGPVDAGAAGTGEAPGFYAGDPVVVAVRDINRNVDPSLRDYVDVDITTTTGDAETLRLLETGPDTAVFAGAIQSVPMPPQATQYDCVLSLAAFAEITARYTDTDFPLDTLTVAAAGYAALPPGKPAMRLTQSVSRQVVEIGEFLQYTLILSNIHEATVYAARIADTLPPGVTYRQGSLRVVRPDGGPQVVPAFAPDGRRFEFPVGNLAPGESATATFVAEVGAGATGPLLTNLGVAHASGALVSNLTDTVVIMREPVLAARMTIIGRVLAGDCDGQAAAEPVRGIRLLMEDGTFVVTDGSGAFHFAGVRPGTHVVQIDPASLPRDLEAAACSRNTRFAGREDSQFVEGQGGSLLRADFRLRRKQVEPQATVAGAALRAQLRDGRLHMAVKLDGNAGQVSRLRATVALPADSTYLPGSATLDGMPLRDPDVVGDMATFDLGDPGPEWNRELAFQLAPGECAGAERTATLMLTLDGVATTRTAPARLTLPCESPPGGVESPRTAVTIAAAPESGPAASPSLAPMDLRAATLSDQAADGAETDWLQGQSPGRDFLFPAVGHNPRSPGIRVVVKSFPGDTVVLRLNGERVPPLNFAGTETSADRTVAVATWTGVDLGGGDNVLQAEFTGRDGEVATIERVVHLGSVAARAELVPDRSHLVADGIQMPVIAVRMLDVSGRPVRKGMGGKFTINAPYTLAQSEALMQQRQLEGTDSLAPSWVVDGDDGIAYITLSPTGNTGSVRLGFDFRPGVAAGGKVHQDLTAWLAPAARDWIVVGVATGSVGYETLDRNMEPLAPGEEGDGFRTNGRIALYAKGRVLGKWLLTMAYDSRKPTGSLRNRSLLSVIDPDQYYTLYGDDTQQGYDAASARKLYLKLERDQFYAMFGDFQTGLDKGELSRYQRSMTGIKVEYRGPVVEVTSFAARTAQHYARDELQGDGTSGLYRLTRGGIVINSERVRIETRERYHSEQIVETLELTRHIDYDIDYENGTLFFRQPIPSRDFDFNPNWIVVEYETTGGNGEFLDAGGRVGARLMDGKLEAGVSYIRDEDATGTSQLLGVDARFRPGPDDEFRAEAAASRGTAALPAEAVSASGNAWLLEWQHRGERFALRAYARRQAGAFGLGQQNATEAGMFKASVEGQYTLDRHWVLRGDVSHLENLAAGAVRDAANVEVAYRGERWGAKGGLKWAHDTAQDGRVAESRLVTLGANRSLLGDRLRLDATLDFALAGANDSVDFPTRLQLGASYALTPSFRVVAAQEFTDGEHIDTSTTRLGFSATPWSNATLSTTLNQSQISEYGPRTFALFGLNQKFLLGERWAFDVSIDSSQAFNRSGDAPIAVDPATPIQAGGPRDGGALTDTFVAVSGGATYRAALWSWNSRIEARQGQRTDRYGFTSAFLRQARDGVAFNAALEAFSQRNADGSAGLLVNAQLGWAYRPTGSRWSILDKLEFRLDQVSGGEGRSILGQNTLAIDGNARSRRLVNNFVLNYAADAWDGPGSVFDFDQRSQLSFYYGSKYVLETLGGEDYAGYTDLMGAEWRFDLTSRIDVGLRTSLLHSWSQDSFAWAFGPSIGFTPFENAWVSVGYNLRGFRDRDFADTHHTAEGAYLVFRVKLDQNTFGLDRHTAGNP